MGDMAPKPKDMGVCLLRCAHTSFFVQGKAFVILCDAIIFFCFGYDIIKLCGCNTSRNVLCLRQLITSGNGIHIACFRSCVCLMSWYLVPLGHSCSRGKVSMSDSDYYVVLMLSDEDAEEYLQFDDSILDN